MSVNGINNGILGRTLGQVGGAGIARPEAQPARTTHAPARPSAAGPLDAGRRAQDAARSAAGLPVEPPPGTDPELWAVLSAEERAFFAKVGAMGPLTYGRMMQAPNAQPPARGVRLDVRA